MKILVSDKESQRKRNYYLKNKKIYIKNAALFKKKNPEKIKEYSKKYRKKYPNKISEWQNERTKEIYRHFNMKCCMCNYNKIPALQLHHKTKKERKRDWFKKNYNLDNLLLLCANCHCLIHYKEKYGTDTRNRN